MYGSQRGEKIVSVMLLSLSYLKLTKYSAKLKMTTALVKLCMSSLILRLYFGIQRKNPKRESKSAPFVFQTRYNSQTIFFYLEKDTVLNPH